MNRRVEGDWFLNNYNEKKKVVKEQDNIDNHKERLIKEEKDENQNNL